MVAAWRTGCGLSSKCWKRFEPKSATTMLSGYACLAMKCARVACPRGRRVDRRTVVERGLVDYLSVSEGEYQDHISHPVTLPGMSDPVAPFLYLASLIKAEVDIPIFHAQRITDLQTAARALAEGHVDMVAMTRPHMTDPHIFKKYLEGREEDIRPCIGANYCIDRFYIRGQARCIHNTAMGHERRNNTNVRKDFETEVRNHCRRRSGRTRGRSRLRGAWPPGHAPGKGVTSWWPDTHRGQSTPPRSPGQHCRLVGIAS